MSDYRFQLDKENNKQMICPYCNEKSFTPYIDTYTNQLIDEAECGICSRSINCRFHLPPREYFKKYPNRSIAFRNNDYCHYETVIEEVPISYIDMKYLLEMERDGTKCGLNEYFERVFKKELIDEVYEQYFIRFKDRAIVFWQVDAEMQIRTGKMMWYDKKGHRTKYMKLLHKELYGEDFELQECYFREHLLKEYPDKEVVIVESEKTCLILSMIYPSYIWLSTGGKLKYMESSWPVLLGHDITLIPDQDAVEEWREMKDEMEILGLSVSLDDSCKNKPEQSDIADLAIQWIEEGFFNSNS